jgi:ParB-like chromosome segregation protein Spo0J
MSTDTDVLHLKSKLEHERAKLDRNEITPKSFSEYCSRIRREATEKGIDPDLVAPKKKREKKLEVKLETIAPSIILKTVKRIPVAEICVEPGIQQRASHVDLALRAEYAEAMKAGAAFPPVVVFDADMLWLADGFHRVGAAEDAGLTEILAEIREGDRRDALLYAVGANAEHGARRTNADKRRAVVTLLNDAEWQGRSDGWIAEAAKVSHPFVGKVRAELQAVKATGNVSSQIDAPAEEAPKSTPAARQGRDGRTTNTSNIGKNRAATNREPSATTAAAQQALHRFGGAAHELAMQAGKLSRDEMFKVSLHAASIIEHFAGHLTPSERSTVFDKLSARLTEEVGHA